MTSEAKKKPAKKRKKTNTKKNPLYAVTHKGSVVQQADNAWDFLLKKFNLEPMLALLKEIFTELLKQARSYAAIQWVSELMDQWIVVFERWLPASSAR